MPKPLVNTMLAAGISLLLATGLSSQVVDKRAFEAKLYSITQLEHFGLDSARFVSLSEDDKASLLACRNGLLGLLQAVERKRPASSYISTELGAKYKDSKTLAALLIEPEGTLLAAGVTNFDIAKSTSEIRLTFFTVVFVDGAVSTSEKTALFKRLATTWRVTAFE